MRKRTLQLIDNEIDTNEAFYQAQLLPPSRAKEAQLALTWRMANGAADAMREHVWQLCAQAMVRKQRRAR